MRVTWHAVAVVVLAVVAWAGPSFAGSPTPGSPSPSLLSPGLCSMLTEEEVSVGLDSRVTVVEDTPDSCVYAAVATGSLTGLAASRERADPLEAQPLTSEPLIEQLRATFPDAEDVELAGLPALATPSEPLVESWTQATLIVFPDPDEMLSLTVVVPEGQDAVAILRTLAALAVHRLETSAIARPAMDA